MKNQKRQALPASPFTLSNIRYFIAFRVFFNSRFYYPVFTIMFLDYGLTIEQFALLNSVWAATIVIAEVPSGALADLMGRKQLLIITSVLMVLEMLLLAFVPLQHLSVVFMAFLINRVLSGLAEAMASGADEALAYDTLVAQGDVHDWPSVLSLMMRLKSLGAVISMALGALLYDAAMVNRILHLAGLPLDFDQHTTMRFPIYLTLLLGFFSCYTVCRMQEITDKPQEQTQTISAVKRIKQALKLTLQAGGWILKTPMALAIILFGMAFDHILRMLITMTSQFLRLVHLPEASFGLVGAAMSIIGLFLPKAAEKMVHHFSPLTNVVLLLCFTLLTLGSLALFIPYFGVIPVAMISAGLMFTAFFSSHYLNAITESSKRATVLSFKGLAFNLAYGLIGVAFATLINTLRQRNITATPFLSEQQLENYAFTEATIWFLPYAIIIFTLVFVIASFSLRRKIHGTSDQRT